MNLHKLLGKFVTIFFFIYSMKWVQNIISSVTAEGRVIEWIFKFKYFSLDLDVKENYDLY